MTKAQPKLICDAGPIIHLDEIGCLDLLNDFEDIIIPPEVAREIKSHRPSVFFQHSSLVTKKPDEKIEIRKELLTLCRSFSLDAGETQALALMEKYPQAIFLTDDAAARLFAERMRYAVHGTIGILVRSIRRGQKKPEEVLTILSEMPLKSSLYIKFSLIDEIMQQIKSKFRL